MRRILSWVGSAPSIWTEARVPNTATQQGALFTDLTKVIGEVNVRGKCNNNITLIKDILAENTNTCTQQKTQTKLTNNWG